MFQRIPTDKTPKGDSFANMAHESKPVHQTPSEWPVSGQGKSGKILAGFSDLVINGHISGEGELIIDGTVNGNVHMTRLTIGTAGNIIGNIEAESLEIHGRVIGNIFAREVKLFAEAFVEGDVSFDQLAIDPGAYFQGRCLQTRGPLSIRPEGES
jgi:cytoskeletal protein CcmA (bactofilin family)